MSKQRLLIFGAGGYALEIYDVIRAAALRNVDGFVIDPGYPAPTGFPAPVAFCVVNFSQCAGALAVGDPRARRRIAEGLPDWTWPYLAHPSAVVSPGASFGRGLYVAQFACVNRGAALGEHVHVNVAAIVAHRVVVGDFVQIGPQAQLLGDCVVGSDVEIGAGAIILPRIRVGNGVTVGAGAIVTRDVPDGATIRGEPARVR